MVRLPDPKRKLIHNILSTVEDWVKIEMRGQDYIDRQRQNRLEKTTRQTVGD